MSGKDRKLTDTLAFSTGIVDELRKYGVTSEQLPNLNTFASIFGCQVNNTNNRKTARIRDSTLSDFLRSSSSVNDDDSKQTTLEQGGTDV